jgi:hypothetical protein
LDRSPAPKCYPGTRVGILNKIHEWIDDPDDTPLCWVHGPAGSGKSAIAQTVADRCADKGQIAASFFFSRSEPPRDTSKLFFTTLAWQLASSMPERRDPICQGVMDGVRILDQQHSTQIDCLIVRPLLTPINSDTGASAFLVIVDGLDECKPNANQIRLLNRMYDIVKTHRLPLRFLIVSRPESHIRGFFNAPRNKEICKEISIYGDSQACGDVHLFLRHSFDEIAGSGRHMHSLQHVPRPWPPDETILLLCRRAEGYFIYASTVLKYVDDEYSSCVTRLEEVLDASGSGPAASVFAELDKLYTQILSTCPNTQLLVRILGGLLKSSPVWGDMPVEALELIYNLQHGEIHQMLRGLHSVFNMSNVDHAICPWTSVHLYHTSFLDFLYDKDRAGVYYSDEEDILRDIREGSISFISDYASRRSSIE